MVHEEGVVFSCQGSELFGILHRPVNPIGNCAMVIVVGGPQYRVGSHRQFVLVSRRIAESGFPVFRFDHRGMGDSSGDSVGFEHIEQDIRRAIDTTLANCQGVTTVALWGLCDAASAIAMYAGLDDRVRRIMLINPWVRTEKGEAGTLLRTYYRDRLFNARAWQGLLTSTRNITKATRSVLGNVHKAAVRRRAPKPSSKPVGPFKLPLDDLPTRVFAGLSRFSGIIHIIVCEKDLTGQEFLQAAKTTSSFRSTLVTANVRQHAIPGADHTFSRAVWRDEVTVLTEQWMRDA